LQVFGTQNFNERWDIIVIKVTIDAASAIVAYNDYYPFGMLMEGRNGANGAWDASYKFTGKERDIETNSKWLILANIRRLSIILIYRLHKVSKIDTFCCQ
jgi:hypothetical protein